MNIDSIKPKFNIALHGYDSDEVDGYIDNLCFEYDKLARYCMGCETKLKKLEIAATATTAVATATTAAATTTTTASPVVATTATNAATQNRLSSDTAATTGDREPDTSRAHDPHTKKFKRIWESRATGALFYIVLIIVVLVLFISFNETDGVPRSILGFSMMTVLTPSMQDQIPKDSLVITRQVDAMTLEIGDDITFLVNEKTTMTHRIVGIYENYMNTGLRGFETKGTMNSSPDREVVAAQNVVGKVVFHNLIFGKAMGFMKKYALWICIFTPLIMGLFVALRIAFAKVETPEGVHVQAQAA